MPAPSGATPEYGFPYLLESDVPDVATASQDLAQAVETVVQSRVGIVEMFAGSTAPSGAILCQGQAVSRSTYASLFAVIGTTWGAGDGSTTFNLPDFRGVSPIGAGTGTHTGTTARTVAAFYGAETISLTQSQLPTSIGTAAAQSASASTTVPGFSFVVGIASGQNDAITSTPGGTSGPPGVTFAAGATTTVTNSTSAVTNSGSGGAHANLGPSHGINFIIWAK